MFTLVRPVKYIKKKICKINN